MACIASPKQNLLRHRKNRNERQPRSTPRQHRAEIEPHCTGALLSSFPEYERRFSREPSRSQLWGGEVRTLVLARGHRNHRRNREHGSDPVTESAFPRAGPS